MYKLERNSPISNVTRNIQKFFPKTAWAGGSFLVSLTMGTVLHIVVHHPSLQATFADVVGIMDCLIASCTAATLAWTVRNFKQEKERWMQLGKKMEEQKALKKQQEKEALSQFITPDQLIRREFINHDKIIPIDFFTTNGDDTGGRQEEVGFSKVLQFPK